jgi:hypothetical protein
LDSAKKIFHFDKDEEQWQTICSTVESGGADTTTAAAPRHLLAEITAMRLRHRPAAGAATHLGARYVCFAPTRSAHLITRISGGCSAIFRIGARFCHAAGQEPAPDISVV